MMVVGGGQCAPGATTHEGKHLVRKKLFCGLRRALLDPLFARVQ